MAIKGRFYNGAHFKACIKQKVLSEFLRKVQLPAGCCAQRWAARRDDYRHRAPGGANLLFWSSSGPVLLHNIGLFGPHAQCPY